jgi:hypothetical protein
MYCMSVFLCPFVSVAKKALLQKLVIKSGLSNHTLHKILKVDFVLTRV